ncbi:MAG: hypothetical protein QNJ36_18165 [Calothrix sp. MO_167.B42]|nr:hypothetical protein [Calothrix sp. MO_167.B42]
MHQSINTAFLFACMYGVLQWTRRGRGSEGSVGGVGGLTTNYQPPTVNYQPSTINRHT